jgi:SAM-dependent methyltransferase
MSSDDAIDFYKRRALDWANDRNRQTAFFEKGWLDRFRALIEPGGTVLDLGCGPGKPTLYHASLSPDEYRALLVANDFTAIDARMEDAECGGRSVWLARRREDR